MHDIKIESDKVIIHENSKDYIVITFDKIRQMSNDELFALLDDIHIDGYSEASFDICGN